MSEQIIERGVWIGEVFCCLWCGMIKVREQTQEEPADWRETFRELYIDGELVDWKRYPKIVGAILEKGL